MNIIDLTLLEESSESEEESPPVDVENGYDGPDLIMGIDIGPRNSGMCVYSIKTDEVIWWVWIDLQGYFPVFRSPDIVDRLTKFVENHKYMFDACDIICIEGQTETQTQRLNMYLQNGFTALFPNKVTIQNSSSMGKVMRKIAPESLITSLKTKGKKSRFIKKKCTEWIGKKMVKNRDKEKMLYSRILRDRKKHQAFLKSKRGKKKREKLEELDDVRLRSIGKGNKRTKNKRIRWSPKLSKEEFDIWDPYIIAHLEAERQTKRDIIESRIKNTKKKKIKTIYL